MSRKKATIWNFAFLNIGFIISIINGVLIIPLYLHYINSSVYGAWLATGNILTWITIVDPGISSVLLQRVAFAIGKDDRREVGLSISSGVVISSLLFLLAVILGYIFSFFIGDIAKIDISYRNEIVSAFRIALWGTTLSLLADTFRNVILAYQKTKIHGIFLNAIVALSIVLNIALLYSGFGIYALAYASLFRGLGLLLFAVIYSGILIKQNKVILTFESAYFKSFSRVFTYTFSSRLFETLASNVDLIIVSRYLGANAVTILDLCRRPIKIISGLTNTITQSMLPTLPHLFGSGDSNKIQETVLKLWNIIVWLSVFIIGGFILFNYNLIQNWVGEQFWLGTTNNIILCISYLFLCVGYNLSNITLSMGDIKNNSLINLVKGLVYILLLVVLAKYFGMTGVVLAYLLSLLILVFYYPQKVLSSFISRDKIGVVIKEAVLLCLFLCLCGYLSYVIHFSLKWSHLILVSGIYAACYVAGLFIISLQFRNEVSKITGTIRKKMIK